MDKRVPNKNRCITVNLFHKGVFIVPPFQYAHSDEKQITDIYFEDIRDQWETMANDGNESSDAYCSSDEEDLSYVDFHTEVDDNVVIKTVTTNDPFLNKLCDDNEHVNENVEIVVEDTKKIDLEFNVKQGISYIRHDPNQDWDKIEPVLGMRTDWRKLLVYCGRDVKAGRCAGRSKTDEGTSKSPKTQVKAITSGKGCFELPKWTKGKCKRVKQRALFDDERGLTEHYRRLAILDSNLGSTCRLEDEETESGNYYFRRFYVYFKDVKEGWLAGCRKNGEESFDHEPYNRNLTTIDANVQTQESVAANMSDKGEIGFRLGNFQPGKNYKSNAKLEIPSEEPIAAVTPSAYKGKQHAEPSEQPDLQPQAKKRG
ncbi:hypothetical protein Tco_0725973 [Tanacetum coccineum]|uniref:Uncharacterized protein n=1 Tax=Tanacetum coccineum TaxID=301880 RepID=A0ABQ4YGU1_9ASTR